MPKSKVVLNRQGFGEQVMASPEMEAQLRTHARAIAAQIPGAKLQAVRTRTAGGGSRVRIRVEAERALRADLIKAMRAVIGQATSR